MLTNGGRDYFAEKIVGETTTAAFNNANSSIGVGSDSATAAAAGQTDLIGASKTRKAMDATFPTRGTGGTANVLTFRSTFGTGDANHVWNEWGVFNTTAATGGTMLNRRVEALGTKPNTQTWQFTVTLTVNAT